MVVLDGQVDKIIDELALEEHFMVVLDRQVDKIIDVGVQQGLHRPVSVNFLSFLSRG